MTKFQRVHSSRLEWLFLLCCSWIAGIGLPTSVKAAVWSNPATIAIVDSAPGSPNPSSIAVTGVTGTITKITVTLSGISHSYPDDIDVLLVGPTGQTVVLLSDAGGSLPIGGVNLTFDDAAVPSVPDAAQIVSGTFKPSNYESVVDPFGAPAPVGPYGQTLSGFLGTNPNGSWSLYVMDDAARDQGTIVNGWSLSISTVVNGLPTITTIPNQSILEDTSTSPIAFTVGDAETPAGSLVVSAFSADTTLVPLSGLVIGGSGANRTLTITPGLNQFGTTTISVSVNDSIDTVTTNFSLTVGPINDPPTIAAIPNQNTAKDTPTAAIPLTIGDPETPAANLTLVGTSSNQGLIQNSAIVFGGSGSNRTVTITPVLGQTGGATITITVTDPSGGTTSASFPLSVSANLTFSNPASIAINDRSAGTPYPSVISVSGVQGTLRTVRVTLNGVNHSYADDIDLLLVSPSGQGVLLMSDAGGSGPLVNTTLTFDDAATDLMPDVSQIAAGSYKPTDYESGDTFASPAPAGPWATTLASYGGSPANGNWSLYVMDDATTDFGNISGGWSITVVSDSNNPPLLSSINPQSIPQNSSSPSIPFTMSDAETAVPFLKLGISSSNSDLLPTNNIVVTGTSTNRSMVITPIAGTYGTSMVTLTVTDEAGATTTVSFLVTVTRAAGAQVTIASSSWSLETDGNLNAYFESARLNWNPDVIGAGSKQVFEKIYWRTNGAAWILYATTAPHTITGTGTGDMQSVDIVEDANKVNAMLVDYKIELYLASQPSTPDDTHIPANDPVLAQHKEEGLPDLTVFAAASQPTLSTVVYQPGDCAVSHGCTQAGTRRLLGFAMQTRNEGKTDLYLGNPVNNPLFVFDPCHGHYHFQGFATYRLLAGTSLVAAGNKVGFCLEDVARFDPNVTAVPKYNCLNQGIQSGWYDNYGQQLTCQWIDITGVPPGNYNLEIAANPFAQLKESNFGNNTTLISVTVTNTAPTISDFADQSLLQNNSSPAIPFTIWDGETDWNALVLSKKSSNPTLIPLSNIVFGGSGETRTVTITPASNQSGSSVISIIVADSNGASATNSFTVVVGNNHAPVLTLGGSTVTYTENDPAMVIAAVATVSDLDNSHFNGGNLTVDITALGQPEDRLLIRNQGTAAGQIGVTGNNVTWGGTVIGSFVGGTNGSTPLVIGFTSTSASLIAVQSLVTNITYFNVSENPSASPRTVRYVLNDGSGGFSAAVTKVIQVVPVNDAPVLTLSPSSTVYSPGSPATIVDNTGTVADIDSLDFQLGDLEVTIIENGTPDDRLTISTSGQIAVFGSIVSYGGITMGIISGGTDGSTPLLLDFDVIPSPVTVAVAQDLVRSIQFYNVSGTPSTLPRKLRFQIADGDGGVAFATNTIIFSATPVDPVITWGNPADIIYGTALGASQLNATANVPGTFVYTPALGAVLSAGAAQNLSVTFTPANTAAYNVVSKTVQINVLPATPVITWANPANIGYGTPLGPMELNAIAGVPGQFTYTPALGTVLHAGNAQTLSVLFTPNDLVNYLPSTKTVSINVAKAPLVVTAPTLPKVYAAAVPTLTASYSGFVNGDLPAVLDTPPAVTTTATAGSAVGTYPTQAAGAADVDYTFTYVNGVLSVTPAPLTITANNKSKIKGTANPTLTVSYAGFVNGENPSVLTSQPTVTTTATASSPVGTYPITVTGAVGGNYAITHVNGTLTVESTTIIALTSAWRQTSVNLDATPAWKTTGYDDSAWATGNALLAFEDNPAVQPINTDLGSVQPTYYFRKHFNFSSTLAPSDRLVFTNFIDDGAIFYLNGQEIARVRMPASPAPVAYADFATATPTGGDATTPDIFFITGSDLSFLVNGDNVIAVEVHQVSTVSSDVVFGSELSLVSLTTPVVTWAPPSPITYGTALSATELSATADVPGTFVYTPSLGAVLNAGSQVLSVTFTPNDTVNYQATTATVPLQVLKAPSVITWANPADIIYGTALSGTELNATANTPGVFTYAPLAGTVLHAGSAQVLSVTFAPTDAANYLPATKSVALNVIKAPLQVTVAPATKVYGDPLPTLGFTIATFVNGDSAAVLDTPPSVSTTALATSPVGSYPITATGGADADYSFTYVNAVLAITPATLTVTAANAGKAYGAALPLLTVSYAGFVNGDTVASLVTPGAASTVATAASPAGTYVIKASSATSPNYTINHVNGVLTVSAVPLTITADAKSRAQGLANPPLTASYVGLVNNDTPASLATGPTLSTLATPASPQGTYPITVTGASSPNYTITMVNGVLTVTPPTLVSIAVTPSAPSVAAGQTQQFAAQGTFTDGSQQNLTATATWQSGNTGVATINNSGLATGVSAGSSLITATSASVIGSANLTVTPGGTSLSSFTNSAPIVIPNVGAGTPYPSTIQVSGMSGVITKVAVTLDGIYHTYPDDIDILLVGPNGQKVMIMSDAGGSPDLVNTQITLDDSASAFLPDLTLITSGTYKPSNFDTTTDVFPAPAPAGPYGAALSDFNGTSPNGTWSLYLVDDASSDFGRITNGWSLTISTAAAVTPPPTFANTAAITIPLLGAATPYPSTIAVSGLSGVISSVTLTLSSVNHTYPDDLDILLVGPAGQKLLLMSDAGSGWDLVNVDLTFDDASSAPLPDSTLIPSSRFKPTNYESVADTFPAPAPAAPYATALSTFIGTNPNGTWSLFVVDDASGDQGSISGGWSLTITTATPPPPAEPVDPSLQVVGFQSVSKLPGGDVQLILQGAIGQTYIIEASTNLLDWTQIGDGTFAKEVVEFLDTVTNKPSMRFYRARISE